jgi:hypothetical protein
MKKISKWIPEYWRSNKNYNQLLIVVALFIFVVIPIVQDNLAGRIMFLFFYYILLASSTPFLLEKHKTNLTIILFIIPFIILVADIIWRSKWTQLIEDLFLLSYFLMLASITLLITFDKGKVNIQRVQGAVISYLLIGLIFSIAYHFMYIGNNYTAFKGDLGVFKRDFVYFSFCTLTTVGYGDITPVSPFARSLSNMESLIGQLFPAILIARLVSADFAKSKSD